MISFPLLQEAFIDQLYKLRGLKIQISYKQRLYEFAVREKWQTYQLKLLVQLNFGVQQQNQALRSNRVKLCDRKTLEDCHLMNGALITVKETSIYCICS